MPETEQTVDQIVDETVSAVKGSQTDELLVDDVQNISDTTPVITIEEYAQERGWKPKDKFKGDERDWRSAREFLDKEKQISERRSNESRSLKKSMEKLVKATNAQLKAQRIAHEKETEALIEERDAAIRDGDVDRVKEIDKDIDNHRKNAPEELEESDDTKSAFDDFLDRNPWYESGDEDSEYLTNLADGIGMRLKSKGLKGEEFFEELEKKMQPHLKKKEEKAPAKAGDPVAAGNKSNRQQGAAKELTYADLTELEREVYKNMSKIPGFDKKAYFKDLAEVRGAGNARMVNRGAKNA